MLNECKSQYLEAYCEKQNNNCALLQVGTKKLFLQKGQPVSSVSLWASVCLSRLLAADEDNTPQRTCFAPPARPSCSSWLQWPDGAPLSRKETRVRRQGHETHGHIHTLITHRLQMKKQHLHFPFIPKMNYFDKIRFYCFFSFSWQKFYRIILVLLPQ